MEGAEEVVSADKDIGTGRIKHTGVGDLLQDGVTVGSYLWVVYMGDDPPHVTFPGGIPVQGVSTDDRTEISTASGRQMVVPLLGGGNSGGGIGGGRILCPEETE